MRGRPVFATVPIANYRIFNPQCLFQEANDNIYYIVKPICFLLQTSSRNSMHLRHVVHIHVLGQVQGGVRRRVGLHFCWGGGVMKPIPLRWARGRQARGR